MFTEELRQQLLLTVRLNAMICIEAEIPPEIYDIDDELKAIYHSRDSFCIWDFLNTSREKQIRRRDNWDVERPTTGTL